MLALAIIAGILIMLSEAAIGAFAVLNIIRNLHRLANIIILACMGVMFIGSILMMIPVDGTRIAAMVLAMLAWPAFAIGFVFLCLSMWGRPVGLASVGQQGGPSQGPQDQPLQGKLL
ncbi:MAG: hypothetical protein HZA50_16800 [Planctomycetes bacterium]|nr:hypothetical protein [Planctomycetota bacterium]